MTESLPGGGGGGDGQLAEFVALDSITAKTAVTLTGACDSSGRAIDAQVARPLVRDHGLVTVVSLGGARRLPAGFTVDSSPGGPDRPPATSDAGPAQVQDANMARVDLSGRSLVSGIPLGVRLMLFAAATVVVFWVFIRIMDGFH